MSCCKNGHRVLTVAAFEVAKDNASDILSVNFLPCPSCYKGLSYNKLANCYKNHLISLLNAFTAEQESKILV